MIQPTLFDNTATAEKPENVAGQLDSLVVPEAVRKCGGEAFLLRLTQRARELYATGAL